LGRWSRLHSETLSQISKQTTKKNIKFTQKLCGNGNFSSCNLWKRVYLVSASRCSGTREAGQGQCQVLNFPQPPVLFLECPGHLCTPVSTPGLGPVLATGSSTHRPPGFQCLHHYWSGLQPSPFLWLEGILKLRTFSCEENKLATLWPTSLLQNGTASTFITLPPAAATAGEATPSPSLALSSKMGPFQIWSLPSTVCHRFF
jgi:hypothetical protein